jgi:hypothetical protein
MVVVVQRDACFFFLETRGTREKLATKYKDLIRAGPRERMCLQLMASFVSAPP